MATIFEKANQILEEKQLKVKPENLKKGISLFGVEGTLETEVVSDPELEELVATENGEYLPDEDKDGFSKVIVNVETGIDTSDATATANDIVAGKSAYVNGEKIEGSMPAFKILGTFTDTTDDDKHIGNSVVEIKPCWNNLKIAMEITSREGYIDLPFCINERPTISLELSKAHLAQEFGITADKIKLGETILDIEGTYEGEAGSGSGDLSDEDLQELLDLAYQIQGTQGYLADKVVLTIDEYNQLISTAKNIRGKEEDNE